MKSLVCLSIIIATVYAHGGGGYGHGGFSSGGYGHGGYSHHTEQHVDSYGGRHHGGYGSLHEDDHQVVETVHGYGGHHDDHGYGGHHDAHIVESGHGYGGHHDSHIFETSHGYGGHHDSHVVETGHGYGGHHDTQVVETVHGYGGHHDVDTGRGFGRVDTHNVHEVVESSHGHEDVHGAVENVFGGHGGGHDSVSVHKEVVETTGYGGHRGGHASTIGSGHNSGHQDSYVEETVETVRRQPSHTVYTSGQHQTGQEAFEDVDEVTGGKSKIIKTTQYVRQPNQQGLHGYGEDDLEGVVGGHNSQRTVKVVKTTHTSGSYGSGQQQTGHEAFEDADEVTGGKSRIIKYTQYGQQSNQQGLHGYGEDDLGGVVGGHNSQRNVKVVKTTHTSGSYGSGQQQTGQEAFEDADEVVGGHSGRIVKVVKTTHTSGGYGSGGQEQLGQIKSYLRREPLQTGQHAFDEEDLGESVHSGSSSRIVKTTVTKHTSSYGRNDNQL
ncbi:hornerin-like isoform X2 [Diabrotica virgifera virgifera]|uniref:Filaggrin-2-like n=1 Tax=Diabrotica virgifera virgifera TaxID=50390 RepID=A0ABM5KRF4_DIAVI|nr:hornerin-like isoform X2 [Diabrotica virgifera virgifera]